MRKFTVRFEPSKPKPSLPPLDADKAPVLPPESAELASRLTAEANQLADLYPASERWSQNRDIASPAPCRPGWNQTAWRAALTALAPLLLIILLSAAISRVQPQLPLAQLPTQEAQIESDHGALPAEVLSHRSAVRLHPVPDLSVLNAVHAVSGPELEGLLDLWGEADTVQRVDLDAILSR